MKRISFLSTLLFFATSCFNAFGFEYNGLYYSTDYYAPSAAYVTNPVYGKDYNGKEDIIIPEYAIDNHSSTARYYTVIGIKGGAFENCLDLKRITIPQTISTIDATAFKGCSNLNNITVNNGNKWFDTRENCNAIIETSSNKLIIACNGSTIPESVTSIGTKAFSCCTQIESFTIPTNITNIEENAFSGCNGLKEIHVLSKNPPRCPVGSYIFDEDTYNNATLYVPKGSLMQYMTKDGWRHFYNVVEEEQKPEPTDYEPDVNKDGTVDIADVNIVINAILGM